MCLNNCKKLYSQYPKLFKQIIKVLGKKPINDLENKYKLREYNRFVGKKNEKKI